MADLFAFPPPPPPSPYFSLPTSHYDKDLIYFQTHPQEAEEQPQEAERTTKTLQGLFGAVSRMTDDQQTKFLIRLIQAAGTVFEPSVFQRVADELNLGRTRGV